MFKYLLSLFFCASSFAGGMNLINPTIAGGNSSIVNTNAVANAGFVRTNDSRNLNFGGNLSVAGSITAGGGSGFTDLSGGGFNSPATFGGGFVDGSGIGFFTSVGTAGNFQVQGTGKFIGNGNGLTNVSGTVNTNSVVYQNGVYTNANFTGTIAGNATTWTSTTSAAVQMYFVLSQGSVLGGLIGVVGAPGQFFLDARQNDYVNKEQSGFHRELLGAGGNNSSMQIDMNGINCSVPFTNQLPLYSKTNPIFQNTNVTLSAGSTFTWTFITPYSDTNYSISEMGSVAVVAPVLGTKTTTTVTVTMTAFTGVLNLIAIHQ